MWTNTYKWPLARKSVGSALFLAAGTQAVMAADLECELKSLEMGTVPVC